MEEIRNLIDKLNYLTKKYDEGHPEVSDKEWDELYYQLVEREKESGLYYPDSPTQTVNYQVVNELQKVEHNHKMLSLDKTKEISEIENFLGDNDCVIMAKLDGLTCSLKYLNGELVSAETRGNGLIGEDITHNARVISSIPQKINFLKELIVDGEILCLESDFQEFAEEYKNPRNFAAGSIRLLDAKECAKRKLTFVVWDMIKGCESDFFVDRLKFAQYLGFHVVPWMQENIYYAIEDIKGYCSHHGYPIDGLVFRFNDIAYGEAQGETSHHFKNAIAYKFYDEIYPTKLINIDWSMGRTGILTPVAVFEPIEIDGSVVERANLHNINIMTDLLGKTPWVGQPINIYKANMIIPQVASAEKSSGTNPLSHPEVCPICQKPLVIKESDNGVLNLVCENLDCDGKLINRLDHFCGKKGLDIKGLSKATLEKLVDWGWVNNFVDIFFLNKYQQEWIKKPGFGKKSVTNILQAIENGKNCSLASFIAALGIPLIGRTVANDLVKYFSSYEEFSNAIKEKFDFSQFDGFADSKTNALLNFDYSEADELVKILNILSEEKESEEKEQPLIDKKYVITGTVRHFKNRAELQAYIESLGGKVVSSVSKNVNYLINNDINSTSAKNVTAKKLGIPILSEEEFLESIN